MPMVSTTAKNLLTNPVQVTLRLDAALLQQLQESAKHSLRSCNAEAVHRLRGPFEGKAEQPFAA